MSNSYQGGRDAAEYYFFWGQKLKPFITKYKFVRKLRKKPRLRKALDFKSFKEEALKDKSFKAEYERLRPEFENILKWGFPLKLHRRK